MPPNNNKSSQILPDDFFSSLKAKLLMNRDFIQFLDTMEESNPLQDQYYVRRLTGFFQYIKGHLEKQSPRSSDFVQCYAQGAANIKSVANDIIQIAELHAPAYDFLSNSAKQTKEASNKAISKVLCLEPKLGETLSPEEGFLRKEGEILNRCLDRLISDLAELHQMMDKIRQT